MNYVDNDRGLLIPEKVKLIGIYDGEIIRDGVVIDRFHDENLVVNQGLNSILNVMFDSATPINSWYLGIFQGNYNPQATDTAATFPAASTECSSYTSATRPGWTPAASVTQSISNAGSPATFTFNGSATIYGGFLVSSNVIAGTGGTLFSAAQFTTQKGVVSGDQLLLTYTFTASSD